MQGTHISSGGNATGASLLLDLFDDDKIRSRPFMSVRIFSGDIQKFTECLMSECQSGIPIALLACLSTVFNSLLFLRNNPHAHARIVVTFRN